MIATSPIRDNKQTFESLRCSHAEKRKIEEHDSWHQAGLA
jgi:hypothetical protein